LRTPALEVSENECYYLLDCDAVSSGRNLLTFLSPAFLVRDEFAESRALRHADKIIPN